MPLAFGLGACDVATPDAPSGRGPEVRLVDAFPSDGCGVGSNADCEMPTNGTLAFRFDRFLNPASVNRQAIRVYSGDPKVFPGLLFNVVYDPVERVVEFRLADGYSYKPGTLYHYKLLVAETPNDFGIQAFDGAPLVAGDAPLEASFSIADGPAELPVESAPSCADIVSHVFSEELGNCATASCHRSFGNIRSGQDLGGAPYGLWLDSRANLAATAIGRVARQTELGDVSGGLAEERSPRFGVRMALIDPKNPGGSYLMYKLLRSPANYEACGPAGSGPFCTDADASVSSHRLLPLRRRQSVRPSDEELARLREWFVRGDPMPLDPAGRGLNIGLDGLRAVSAFIADGASCAP